MSSPLCWVNNTMYKIMYILTYTYSQNTTFCQIVSLCNKQHYVIYNNYMFRPCKRAIIRLFTETSIRLHNRSLGGGRDLIPPNSLCNMQHYVIYNNYMFRPCKWAIIRLFVESVSWLYNRSLGGKRSHTPKLTM